MGLSALLDLADEKQMAKGSPSGPSLSLNLNCKPAGGVGQTPNLQL